MDLTGNRHNASTVPTGSLASISGLLYVARVAAPRLRPAHSAVNRWPVATPPHGRPTGVSSQRRRFSREAEAHGWMRPLSLLARSSTPVERLGLLRRMECGSGA